MTSLRANFISIVSGRSVYAASQWLIIVLLARYLSTEDVGRWSYALALTGPIFVFAQVNLRAFMATDIAERYQFGEYLLARLIAVGTATIIVVIVAFSISRAATDAILIVLVASFKAIESLSDVFYGLLQKHEAMGRIGVSVGVRGLLGLLPMAIAVLATSDILVGAAGIVLMWLAVLLLFDVPNARRYASVECGSAKQARSVLITCLPIGVNQALVTLKFSIPAILVEATLGFESLGKYSAAAYFLIAGNLLMGSLIQASAPRLAKLHHARSILSLRKTVAKMLILAAVAGTVGVVVSVVFGDQILAALYGHRFSESGTLLVLVMIAGAVGYLAQFLGMLLTIVRSFRAQVLTNLLAVVVAGVVAYLLIPELGVNGGAAGLIGAAAITLICYIVLVYCFVPTLRSNVAE